MEFEQVLALIQAVSDSDITSFSYEKDGTSIKLEANRTAPAVVTGAAVPAIPMVNAQEVMAATAAVPASGVAVQPTESSIPADAVKSPLVGTFYAAPSPEENPYVKIGDHVVKGQVLGIIEAMKLMNEIESEKDGVVKEILVKNGDVVEFDQPLFVIE
jgi:acetyl-CoA carboxylase biotin carboxyl carrier protein